MNDSIYFLKDEGPLVVLDLKDNLKSPGMLIKYPTIFYIVYLIELMDNDGLSIRSGYFQQRCFETWGPISS